MKFGEFLSRIGLSQEQYEEVGKVIIPPRKDEEEFFDWSSRWERATLREVLFAKYLSSMGLVDIQSGFFKRLIKKVFPSFDERVWEIIDKKTEQPSKSSTSDVTSSVGCRTMPGFAY